MRIKRLFTIAVLVFMTGACSHPHAEYSRTKVAGDAPAADEEAKEQDAWLDLVASNGPAAIMSEPTYSRNAPPRTIQRPFSPESINLKRSGGYMQDAHASNWALHG